MASSSGGLRSALDDAGAVSDDGDWAKAPEVVSTAHPSPTLTPAQRPTVCVAHKSLFHSWLARRPSIPSPTAPSHPSSSSNVAVACGHGPSAKAKGKDRSLACADPSGCAHDADDLVAKFSNPSTVHDSSSHVVPLHPRLQNNHTMPFHACRPRTGLLSAASDALGLRRKIGSVSRKKPTSHCTPHASNVMPGVIEINACNDTTITSTVGGTTAHRDYEHEERDRLRDAAAHSIGLDPELLNDSRQSESLSSLDSPQGPPPQPAPTPSFPATLAALRPLTELSATLPKFTPPSSILVYALAKQWKPRTIVLTSHAVSQKTHVHLFKGASPDEKELERLEITEDSVIFVAEEEVGGRGNVVKVAGKHVGAKRSVPSEEDAVRSMWFLQITDPTESQRWIAAIKNAILSQRALRAGLDILALADGGHEPKGDMDVMLSMHLQGIISTQPTKPPTGISPSIPLKPSSPSPPSSLRSVRISPSPATAIKGIFTGTRPRSPSLEGSPSQAHLPGHAEDSFGAVGTSLLTMLRTNASTDPGSSPSLSLPLPLPHIPRQGSPAQSLRSTNAPVVIAASDLKISKERDVPEVSIVPEGSSTSTPPSSNTPPTPSLSPPNTLTLSLQPPPRKCKYAAVFSPVMSLQEQQAMYKQATGNRSVSGNFGIPTRAGFDAEDSPTSRNSSACPSGLPRSLSPNRGIGAPSPAGEAWGSELTNEATSTLARSVTVRSPSPDGGSVPTDKLLHNTSITKRWSRQGIPLPKRLTPPSGPPPATPYSPENNRRTSMASSTSTPHPYAADRPPSTSSSNSHSPAGISPRSSPSLSATCWNRTSGSSRYSASSMSTSDSRAPSHIPVPVAESFLESVVGNAALSRPMSLSMPRSSPAAHVGTAKRRSMPPPRPAPNFAPPPAPMVRESTSGLAPSTEPAPSPQKSFRTSVAQRALRLSLTAPKPPPSSDLPPRPDEAAYDQGHRRNSTSGNIARTGTSVLYPIPPPSSRPASALSGNSSPIQPTSPPSRGFSIRQRLRILSNPPTLMPPVQVSTLDLSEDNDDEPSTPYLQSPQPFWLGEHITTMQNDPSFLQLSTPITPTMPKPPPRRSLRPMSPSSSALNGLRTPPLKPDRDFVALSPPPPRRGSKPNVVTVTQPENFAAEMPELVHPEESKLVTLSQRGSVVSLGFVTTS